MNNLNPRFSLQIRIPIPALRSSSWHGSCSLSGRIYAHQSERIMVPDGAFSYHQVEVLASVNGSFQPHDDSEKIGLPDDHVSCHITA